ncbi:alkaline phosphatase [Planctomycetota bacterium]
MRKLSNMSLLVLMSLFILLEQSSLAAVKNVIILIGDGMGFEQVKAASLFGYGQEGSLSFEQYYRGELATHSANSYLSRDHATDSAAAATAMATGQKVNNDVVSEDANEPLKTILEYSQERGKATGLVTTVPATHATPAGFGAHNITRNNFRDIAEDYLNQSRPNILFSTYLANESGITPRKARLTGYTVAKTRREMQDMVEMADNNFEGNVFLAGLFMPGDDLPYEYDYYRQTRMLFPYEGINLLSYDVIPHLSEMTSTALSILDNDPDGFFLMVEGGSIDHAGHSNIIERNVYATLEFDEVCKVVFDWAENREDTLVVIAADHETGWLKVIQGKGRGIMPEVFWGSGGHSGANVPVYATGQGAEEFVGVMDNTDIFNIIMKLTNE